MNLKDRHDLTRWNRAGLERFRYVDGNAALYLETLRQALVQEFDQGDGSTWRALVERLPQRTDESAGEFRDRVLAQYYDQRRDYAWEILRTFARCVHVLGEYIDAYANESYLPTAREWDNVRRLVGMLGYRPGPPASAFTSIALLFKEGESGVVEPGFAIKNRPGKGEPTVVFETLEAVRGSSHLNRLRLRNWNRNPRLLIPESVEEPIFFPLERPVEGINVGDRGVLTGVGAAIPIEISGLWEEGEAPSLQLRNLGSNASAYDFPYHATQLWLDPAFVAKPLPNGPHSARLAAPAQLAEGELVFVKADRWVALRVARSAQNQVRFQGTDTALRAGAPLYRAGRLKKQKNFFADGTAYIYVMPSGEDRETIPLVDEELRPVDSRVETRDIWGSEGIAETIRYITGDHGESIYYPQNQALTYLAQFWVEALRFNGKPAGVESGAWVLLEGTDGTVTTRVVEHVEQGADHFELRVQGAPGEIRLVRANFKLRLRPLGHDVNEDPAWSDASNASVTVLELEDAEASASLAIGQPLICAGDHYAVRVEIRTIENGREGVRLHVEPPFHLQEEASSLNRHQCLVYGNVASAGHGESQPEKILGSGDASRTNQRFPLPPDAISWVADKGFSGGVRADLVCRVGNRIWEQVENLTNSAPEAHHYQVDVDQNGRLWLRFGDGRHGRRLPTGVDNVRVRYRTGHGEEGNLPAGALTRVKQPHPLLEGFEAPLPAQGGAEKESAESMRDGAPATVLALDRAVSLNDFSHLAARHSMVWQARAFERMPGHPGRQKIEVVVVAAGGMTFTPDSQNARQLEAYLQSHALPDTSISVISHFPIYLDLALTLTVDRAAYDPRQVETAMRQAIESRFGIRQRRLGQPLFRSEVIALLESVEGVENGHCTILDTPYRELAPEQRPRLHRGTGLDIRRVSPRPEQLLYLDPLRYPPRIQVRELGV